MIEPRGRRTVAGRMNCEETIMETAKWNEQRILQMIRDGVEESLHLDYKAAGALAKTPQRRDEIIKDVTAFANSDGGILIYGVMEHSDKDRRHLPEKIDPVDRAEFSKEWLEHVIGNSAPRIPGIKIHPIPLGGDRMKGVYVVEIPRGTTAYQAKDGRYYRRFNFESVFMADYEIRDVMARLDAIEIQLEAHFNLKDPWEESYFLIRLKNTGRRAALRYSCLVKLPLRVGNKLINIEGEGILGSDEGGNFMEFNLGQDARAVPLFPRSEITLSEKLRADVSSWKDARTGENLNSSKFLEIFVYADDMSPLHAKFDVSSLIGKWGAPFEIGTV